MSSMKISNLTKQTLNKMFAEGKEIQMDVGSQIQEILKLSNDISYKAEGSARVKMGKTEVIVGVKMQLGEPYPDSPDKGTL